MREFSIERGGKPAHSTARSDASNIDRNTKYLHGAGGWPCRQHYCKGDEYMLRNHVRWLDSGTYHFIAVIAVFAGSNGRVKSCRPRRAGRRRMIKLSLSKPFLPSTTRV
ncbi:hypothetical protein JG687_00019521 [Phytophthora cactorum]|uniref:Uncharacterized protein n=1 Tax=Phytophthora cactorum TaxID=29920 RepID=A0A8T1TK99_9STRA|nr:hypothetical protein JG687_00019521 [Phytophthora cactorum]